MHFCGFFRLQKTAPHDFVWMIVRNLFLGHAQLHFFINQSKRIQISHFLCCRYDFFVVSQSGTRGNFSPTSYNIISDNTGPDPDKMQRQRLAYKLTHCYLQLERKFYQPSLVTKSFINIFWYFSGILRVSSCTSAVYAQAGSSMCSMFLHRPLRPTSLTTSSTSCE